MSGTNEVVRTGTALSPVAQAVRDQITADLGVRTDPADLSRRVQRVHLLREYLDGVTFTVLLHWLTSSRRGSVHTRRGYADDVLRFARWLQQRTGQYPADLFRVTRSTIQQWVVWADSEELSARTQLRMLATLSSLFNYAIKHGAAVANPVDYEDHAKRTATDSQGRPDKAARVLPLPQVAAMRDQCRAPGERLAFALMFTQGLRESEVIGVSTDDLDNREHPATLTVHRKGDKHAVRLLDTATAAQLTATIARQPDGPVFLNPDTGRPRSRHYLIRLVRRLAKHAGVERPETVTPHCLRATAITAQLDSGKPLHEVQKWAAHSNSSTTQGYWDRTDAPRRDAALSSSLTALLDEAAAGINP